MPRTRKSKAPPVPTILQSSLLSPSLSTSNPLANFPLSMPANWPSHLTYLARPIYSPNLTPLELTILHTPPSKHSYSLASNSSVPIPASGPSPHISIQLITSPPTHPAVNQYGLFATQPLPPGNLICDYMGYVHPSRPLPPSRRLSPTGNVLPANTDGEMGANADTAVPDCLRIDTIPTALEPNMDAAATSSDYDLSLHRELGIGIDASGCGNEARFINDYRGIRATPNAQFEEHWVRLPRLGEDPSQEHWQQDSGGLGRRWKWELRMGVSVVGPRRDGKGVGKRGILAGDEIVVSYGKGFWRERETEFVEECEDWGATTSIYEHGEPFCEEVGYLRKKPIR